VAAAYPRFQRLHTDNNDSWASTSSRGGGTRPRDRGSPKAFGVRPGKLLSKQLATGDLLIRRGGKKVRLKPYQGLSL